MQEVSCFECDFPIATEGKIGQDIKCPYCSARGTISNKEADMRSKVSTNQVSTKIGNPGPGFKDFFLGLVIGTIFSSVILTSTRAGVAKLEELARQKIR